MTRQRHGESRAIKKPMCSRKCDDAGGMTGCGAAAAEGTWRDPCVVHLRTIWTKRLFQEHRDAYQFVFAFYHAKPARSGWMRHRTGTVLAFSLLSSHASTS